MLLFISHLAMLAITCLMVIVGERERRVPLYAHVVCAGLLDQLTILKCLTMILR